MRKVDIQGYEGLYQITDTGEVYSLSTGKYLKQGFNRQGYCVVGLSKNGKTKGVRPHQLVAKHFIPYPQVKYQVNHKNSDKTDNKVENLEWVTARENVLHRYASIGMSSSKSVNGTLVERKCNKCGLFKSISNYYSDKTKFGGVGYICKKCAIEKRMMIYEQEKSQLKYK